MTSQEVQAGCITNCYKSNTSKYWGTPVKYMLAITSIPKAICISAAIHLPAVTTWLSVHRSYLMAEPQAVVYEVGFVMLDPTLNSLPSEVKQGVDPACLPVIGSSPDGIILQSTQPKASHLPWREAMPSARCEVMLLCSILLGYSCVYLHIHTTAPCLFNNGQGKALLLL